MFRSIIFKTWLKLRNVWRLVWDAVPCRREKSKRDTRILFRLIRQEDKCQSSPIRKEKATNFIPSTWFLNQLWSKKLCFRRLHCPLSKVFSRAIMEQFLPMARQERERPIQWKETKKSTTNEVSFLEHLSTSSSQSKVLNLLRRNTKNRVYRPGIHAWIVQLRNRRPAPSKSEVKIATAWNSR